MATTISKTMRATNRVARAFNGPAAVPGPLEPPAVAPIPPHLWATWTAARNAALQLEGLLLRLADEAEALIGTEAAYGFTSASARRVAVAARYAEESLADGVGNLAPNF